MKINKEINCFLCCTNHRKPTIAHSEQNGEFLKFEVCGAQKPAMVVPYRINQEDKRKCELVWLTDLPLHSLKIWLTAGLTVSRNTWLTALHSDCWLTQ